MSKVPALVADSFCVERGQLRVLTAASMSLAAGTITILVGRNGAGKTTLLRAIVGELSVLSGRLSLADSHLVRWRRRDIGPRKLWWWPQEGFLAKGLTIAEHATLALDVPPEEAMTRLRDAARPMLDASSTILDAPVAALSTGERRVVEAALIIAARPEILLADEPFASLSPAVATLIGERLRALSADGSAICVSTHSRWLMEAFATRVVWLISGTTHQFDSSSSALADWAFQREYLGET